MGGGAILLVLLTLLFWSLVAPGGLLHGMLGR
jgi:hypothetical protein